MKRQTITIEPAAREIPILALTVEEAAESIGIGETKMWELLKDKKIVPVYIGRKPVIPRVEIERFLRDSMEKAG